jgi:hypothetical protein
MGIALALVIAGAFALGVGNTPPGQSAESTCSLKLTNWVSLPSTNSPYDVAFDNDPTLSSWIASQRDRFYLNFGSSLDARAFAQLQTDATRECTALKKGGFKIATIPSAGG